jgi:hypothetical protein
MEPKDGFMGQRCFNEFAKSRRSNEKTIPFCPLKEEEDARFIIFFIHNLGVQALICTWSVFKGKRNN